MIQPDLEVSATIPHSLPGVIAASAGAQAVAERYTARSRYDRLRHDPESTHPNSALILPAIAGHRMDFRQWLNLLHGILAANSWQDPAKDCL